MKNKFKIKFNESTLQELYLLCDEIEYKLNNNQDCTDLIKSFNSKVNHIPDITDFQQYYSWTDKEGFIKSLLIPKVVMDKSLEKEDFIELINLLINYEDEEYEEYEELYWLNILQVNLCSNISDFIFYNQEGMTAEEIYNKCIEDKEKIIYL